MTKSFTESDFSESLDSDLTWRIRELSDLKSAIRNAPQGGRAVLLKSLVAIAYAHWEGYVRGAARSFFKFLTLRRKKYLELDKQFYTNYFLRRLDSFSKSKQSLSAKCQIVEDILSQLENRFSKIDESLIDTRSNLNTEVLNEICIICGVDFRKFEPDSTFIDTIILKRRNSIAHGNHETIGEEEIELIVTKSIGLMRLFGNQLESKIYDQGYLRT